MCVKYSAVILNQDLENPARLQKYPGTHYSPEETGDCGPTPNRALLHYATCANEGVNAVLIAPYCRLAPDLCPETSVR